jgi:hypothetical protein
MGATLRVHPKGKAAPGLCLSVSVCVCVCVCGWVCIRVRACLYIRFGAACVMCESVAVLCIECVLLL